jgi:hypothetical protein
MLVRELKDKGATIAWSPVAGEPSLLALASKEGGGAGFDDYGGELQVISGLILIDRTGWNGISWRVLPLRDVYGAHSAAEDRRFAPLVFRVGCPRFPR